MENKKQLLIIPPMSEPLQKLNEVLNGIATDENIEISIIDDLKELSQFVGSSGQCLIAFSNAKKCATFLQDNRFIIAKTHTKVILLTPKEIPAKTLVKFTKIGLTESILENSPPKTLLYKVKLLLRSIKTSSGLDDKELAVKTMGDTAATQAQAKGDINSDKLQADDGSSVNYLAEERAKFKKNDQENGEAINYGENLKGKTSAQEETIDTHWKSKRKKEEGTSVEEQSDFSKVQIEDSTDIDMYYRGKKKTNDLDIIESDQMQSRKKMDNAPQEDEDLYGKKLESTELDLAPGEVEKRKKLHDEEDAGYELKQPKATYELEAADENKEKRQLNEEDEEERKRKELLELEALFEEAQKKQKEKEAEDLGGHYKGKINNIGMDLEEPEVTEERKEYDNSDLYKKEKPLELELVPVTEEKRRHMQEEEDAEEKERNGFGEKIDSNMSSEDGQVDHIETLMKSDVGRERMKSAQMMSQDREKNKNKDAEENSDERKSNLDNELVPGEDPSLKKKLEKELDPEASREKSIDLDLAPADNSGHKREMRSEDEDNTSGRDTQAKLKLVEEDRNERTSGEEEDGDSFSSRKIDVVDKEDTKKKDLSSTGKVDKIDSFLRGGEAKKKDLDWDLNERKNSIDLGLEKSAKRGPDNVQKKESIDLGEQTIDYRQMKQEFEAISRGEDIYGEDSGATGTSGNSHREHEDDSFKVIELEAAGFEFAINILNMIYQKEIKPEEFYKAISTELELHYRASPVFYSYKASDKKHTEVYDGISQMPLTNENNEFKSWWVDYKKDETVFKNVFNDAASKTMSTWVCREINWEDVELPSWAANELTNKKVELIYPYYDGVDRMGMAVLYFPNGINPKDARGIEVTLEMARSLMLDTIQRQTSPAPHREEEIAEETTEKKNILNVFSGFFKGKKAG